MTQAQACEQCAKRKVRCDRAEPSCSNCKKRRRKHHEDCVYPDASPALKIQRLEETVRSLQESPQSSNRRPSGMVAIVEPESDTATSSTETAAPSTQISAETPLIIRQGGSSVYIESEGWQSWSHGARLDPASATAQGDDDTYTNSRTMTYPEKHLPHAFQTQGSLWILGASVPASVSESTSSVNECPIPSQDALRLWDAFIQRVEPVTRINFDWTLANDLEPALSDNNRWRQLSTGNNALILSICLFGAVSLTNDECVRELGRPKSSLLSEYRAFCESALLRCELLAVGDISILKALCFYIVYLPSRPFIRDLYPLFYCNLLTRDLVNQKSSIDTVTTQSLWTLMGLVSRSAENLGLHRDGQLLGLSPAETEDRRRLWWQLQQLDLALAFKRGVTPTAFSARWDAKMPLNIECADISPTSKDMPRERRGLTSMSYVLFTYHMVEQQRTMRLRQSTPTDESPRPAVNPTVLGPMTNEMIDQIEVGLNTNFLQYCDPIKPLDVLLQISARALVCIVRLRKVHEARLAVDAQSLGENDSLHRASFDTALQCLKYCAAGYAQPALRPFQWLLDASFPWHALIGLLVDMTQISTSLDQVKEAWDVLADLYALTPFLLSLSAEDRRRKHAARSVVVTWQACQQKPTFRGVLKKPAFVSLVEEQLAKTDNAHECDTLTNGRLMRLRTNTVEATRNFETSAGPGTGNYDGSIETELFTLSYADIDWSFWDSIS